MNAESLRDPVTPNIGPWHDEGRCARRLCGHPESWHHAACDEDTCECEAFLVALSERAAP